MHTICCTVYKDIQSTPQYRRIPGLAKRRQYWKTTVQRESIFYILRKKYSGLENQRRYCGGDCQRRGGTRGDDCIVKVDPIAEMKKKFTSRGSNKGRASIGVSARAVLPSEPYLFCSAVL